jgi:hypothetical protein
VKVRHAKGRNPETVTVIYNGYSRPEKELEVTLEETILQFISDAGESGTSSTAIRNGVGGARDKVDAALSNLKGQYYCDGKRGPGNHIWDIKYMPESADDDDADDQEGALVAA